MRKFITIIYFALISIISGFAQTATDFSFTDIDGNTHILSETLADGKVVFLDLFFVDCPYCLNLVSDVEHLIADYEGTTLEVWALSDRDSDDAIRNSVFNTSYTNHFLGGVNGDGASVIYDIFDRDYGFTGFPTYAVICNDGSITWDIWPVSAGLDEIRSLLTEECGVVALTDVENIPEVEATKLYPNPASGSVMLEFGLENTTTMAIEVINILGQQVKSIPAVKYAPGKQTVALDVSELSNGLYKVRLQSETGVSSLSLIVGN